MRTPLPALYATLLSSAHDLRKTTLSYKVLILSTGLVSHPYAK